MNKIHHRKKIVSFTKGTSIGDSQTHYYWRVKLECGHMIIMDYISSSYRLPTETMCAICNEAEVAEWAAEQNT